MSAPRRNARRQPASLRQRLQARLPALQRLGQQCVSALALTLIAGVLYLAVDALRTLPVERIVVSGKLEHLRREAVREALAGKLDGGLLFLDLGALRDQLEALPWVYRAQLRRRFPGTLEVRVQEQLPIARWGEDGFLNHEARIIEVSDAQRWQDLPLIRGPQASEQRLMNHYQRLRAELRPLDLIPVDLREDELGQLQVVLDNGLQLQLGDHDFALRLQRFLSLWERELSRSEVRITRVDMRYEGGAAVALEVTPSTAELIADIQGK